MSSYSNLGLRIKATFTPADFINNPKTCELLVTEFREKFEENITPEVSSFYENLRKLEHDLASSMLRHDKGGEGIAELMYILNNNVKKVYNFEMFFDNPELAKPLLDEYNLT